jgi:hypothetical protein
MDWKGYEGKKVFLRTKQGKVYSGVVKIVEKDGPITFIYLKDKFDMFVTIVHSEIIEIKEER